MKNIHFNEIRIFKNLKPGENSANKLYEDLSLYKYKHPDILDIYLDEFETKDDLKKLFEDVKDRIKTKKRFPIIHFEAHGNKEGIRLSSGILISWSELNEDLLSINFLYRNELIVAMGVCFGFYIEYNALTALVSIDRRGPYFGLLGSHEELSNDEIYVSFYKFYTKLLNGNDFQTAFKEVDSSIILRSSEEDIDSFIIEMKKGFDSDNFKNVCIEFLNRALQEGHDPLPHKPYIEKLEIVKAYKIHAITKYLKETREKYLMIDMFPESSKGFRSFEDVWNDIPSK